MICPNCKKTYNSHQNYCISCGTVLVPETPEEEQNIRKGVFEDIPNVSEEKAPAVSKESERNTDIEENKAFSCDLSNKTAITMKRHSSEKLFSRIMKGTAALVFSLLLFCTSVLVLGTVAGRSLTDRKNIYNAVQSIDLLDIPCSQLGMNAGAYGIPDNATVEEAIAVMTSGSGVDRGNIRRIYEASTMTDFLAEKAAEYGEFLRNGTRPGNITADELKNLLNENVPVISRNTGYTLIESDIDMAYEEIERASASLVLLSASAVENSSAGSYIRLARAYISVPFMAAELILGLAIIVIIALTCRSVTGTLKYTGIPLILSGAASLVMTFMFSMQIGVFSGQTGLSRELIRCASAAVSDNLYRAGGVLLISGILALALSAAADYSAKNRTKVIQLNSAEKVH